MKRTLSRTIVYPHPIDRVWAALTDRTALAQWLMPNDLLARVVARLPGRRA